MKKVISAILTLTVLFSLCAVGAYAVEARASLTITYATASAKAGSRSGEINITYNVRSSKTADSIGVESIAIYKSGGGYVTTIDGTTSSGGRHNGTTTYKGVSGTSYYAVVTLYAEVGSEYDSTTITTSTVKAP